MKKIQLLLDEIQAISPDWEIILNDAKYPSDLKDTLEDKYNQLENAILHWAKAKIDSDSYDDEWPNHQQLKGITKNQLQQIQSDLEGMIWIYQCLRPVREKKNINAFLTAVMERACVYHDPNFLEQYRKYGFQDPTDFFHAVNALEAIVDIHIQCMLPKDAAQMDFGSTSGLPDPYCDSYGTLYEKYYDKLRVNLLMKKLKKQKKMIKKLQNMLKKDSK